MNSATIDNLYERQFLSELDYRFARFIGRLDQTNDVKLLLAASLVSRYRGEGHICIDLSELAGTAFELQGSEPLVCPPLETWLNVLDASPVVGRPGDYRPLILNGARLYLYRYWDYEKRLADVLKDLAGNKFEAFDELHMEDSFERIFPRSDSNGETDIDWRKIAAFASLRNGLCVISGGPGTGKTFAVARILALLIEQNRDGQLNIALTAPTGKAAGRLQESIKKAKSGLNCSESVKTSIPDEASTIHRLLGSIPNSPSFRFNEENPLPFDIVIIDEASMVDLALFSRLVQAIRPQSRLILLGDKDQLASVEAGSVLGDICDTGNIHRFSPSFIEDCRRATGEEISDSASGTPKAGMNDCIIQLTKSYRFSTTSGIRAVSQAVNAGNGPQAIDLIRNEKYGDIHWKSLPRPDELPRRLKDWITERYTAYLKASDPMEALDLFNRSRILSALREGPYGVHNLNIAVEHLLQRKGLIDRSGRWYSGRPVMITKNDYNLRLFNGDIGITMMDHEKNEEMRVFFPGLEGSAKSFPPLRLPDHETVYAMTVHKSQGSEFDDVLLVMPDRDTRVMTRELIYTAITRAKERIQIWGKEDIFLSVIQRRIKRSSGLRDALWGEPVV
ncbi:MAG: exodeoxyribonuclease V subunit alpha [Deltaproteobacteria bacterium]|nr:exodeoxyribonuclease V subunit alpha [Deltaproteobacteria bacterium]